MATKTGFTVVKYSNDTYVLEHIHVPINQLRNISVVSFSIFLLHPGCLPLTLLHLERPKLYTILAFLSATGLILVVYYN